ARARAGGRLRGLQLSAQLGPALSGTRGAGCGHVALWAGPDSLRPHRRRHHRPPRGGSLTTMNPGAQAVLDAGGAATARIMDCVERRMAELATGHGPVLARHAGETISAGGKRLRPLLVCLAAGAPPPETDGLVRA